MGQNRKSRDASSGCSTFVKILVNGAKYMCMGQNKKWWDAEVWYG